MRCFYVLLALTLVLSIAAPSAAAKLPHDFTIPVLSSEASTADGGALRLRLMYSNAGKDSQYYVQEGTTASPCADLDGDGKKEIVFNVRDIMCLDAATGTLRWRVASGHDRSERSAKNFGIPTNHVPTLLEDLDGDGIREIITFTTSYAGGEGSSTQSVVGVYDPSGYFKFPPIAYNFRIYAAKVSDLDGDGTKELIVGLGVGQYSTFGQAALYVYNCDGSLRAGWPQSCDYGFYANSLTTADLDGDGVQEILCLYDAADMLAFHADGTKVVIGDGIFQGRTWQGIWICESYEQELGRLGLPGGKTFASGTREYQNVAAGTHSGLVVDDVDGDGVQEIVCTAAIIDWTKVAANMAAGNSYANNLRYFAPFILRFNRERYTNPLKGFDWRNMPKDTGAYRTLDDYVNLPNPDVAPAVADLDGDGNKEIVFSSYDGRVHCFSLDGTEHGAWPFDLNTEGSNALFMPSKPLAADITGDGIAEVIFTSYPEMNATPRQIGSLYVLDAGGNVLFQTKLPRSLDATGYNAGRAEPVMADVDNDGKPELVITTYSSGVCVYKNDNYHLSTPTPLPVAEESISLPPATRFVPYSASLPNGWHLGGTLPEWLSISGDILSGVPTQAGEYPISLTKGTQSRNITLLVRENGDSSVRDSTTEGYRIVEAMPDIADAKDTTFVIDDLQLHSGSGDNFDRLLDVYLNGRKLTGGKLTSGQSVPKNWEYYAERGSSRITIREQTLDAVGTGTSTIAVTYTSATTAGVTDVVSMNYTNYTFDSALEPDYLFSDAEQTRYRSAIKILSLAGHVDGFEDGTFRPMDSLTRAQAAKLLASMLGARDTRGRAPFADALGHWAENSISYCASQGIVSGVSDNRYDPDAPITGYAWTKMIFCARGFDEQSNGFTGADWQTRVLDLIYRYGIDRNMSRFEPEREITREEACQLMYNAFVLNLVPRV